MNDTGIIWLASYPRSGNTWVRLLLAHALAASPEAVDLNRLPFGSRTFLRELVDDILGVETSELSQDKVRALWPRTCCGIAETLSAPRFAKSHARCPAHVAERNYLAAGTAGVILITRHPAHVAVSLSKFLDVSLDEAISIMADEQYHITHPPCGILENLPQWVGSWSSNLNSWLDSGLRLLLVRYEDILASPLHELSRIISFSGIDQASCDILGAVENTQIGRLQILESLHGFHEAPRTPTPFFRSGGEENGKSSVSKRQSKTLTLDHSLAMARLHYE